MDNNLRVPCTSILQQKLGLTNKKVYEPYFNAFIRFTNSSWNSLSGRMRDGEWTEAAHSFFGSFCKGVSIPLDLHRKFFFATEDFPNITRITDTMDNNLREKPVWEKWCRPFYHSTVRSPHRRYHYLQSLKTEEKKTLFKGCINVDIVSCFQSLWWHELGGKDCTLPFAYLLNPLLKADLHSKIANDFCIEVEEDIKTMRQMLCSDYRNGYPTSSGHAWFDILRQGVQSDCLKFGLLTMGWKFEETNCHRVFTHLEGIVIERMRTVGDEALLMHDGVIYWKTDVDELKKAAHPHLLKVEQW
jgi:hypothetical protein